MAPDVLGVAGSVYVNERASEHGRLQLLGRRNVRNRAALLHHHTNTDARERYAARRCEVAGFVVIVHRRHREDDGIERLLREFLVDVKRWSLMTNSTLVDTHPSGSLRSSLRLRISSL
jgi:hypothetical protein